MFYLLTGILIILVTLVVLFLSCVFFLRCFKNNYIKKVEDLKREEEAIEKKLEEVSSKLQRLEHQIDTLYFMYELIEKILPLVEEKDILKIVKEDLEYFVPIQMVDFFSTPGPSHLIHYRLNTQTPLFLGIKTEEEVVRNNLDSIIKLINLCLEKIGLYKKLQEVSIHDSLTSLYNRRYFTERFEEEYSRAKKFELPLSLLMIDIDYFKKINDTYGHLVGDIVLKEVAFIIRENVREIDFVARYGGEEFIVILPETEKKDAFVVGERIVKKVDAHSIEAFDEKVKVTVSVGVASFPEDSRYKEPLLEAVDRALYKAKKEGRNRVVYL